MAPGLEVSDSLENLISLTVSASWRALVFLGLLSSIVDGAPDSPKGLAPAKPFMRLVFTFDRSSRFDDNIRWLPLLVRLLAA